jgi:hypothetical protein
MQEVTQPNRAIERPGPGGLGSIFGGGNGAAAPTVVVSHGTHTESLPVGNMSVGEIRRRFADRLHIAPTSMATVDGHDANENTIVRAGQRLQFHRHAGEKGSSGMEGWKDGREGWKDGRMEEWGDHRMVARRIVPAFQSSKLPIFLP